MNKINSRHLDKLETSPKAGISSIFSNISKWEFAPVRSGRSLIKLLTALLVVSFLTVACSSEEDVTVEGTIGGIAVKYLGYERDTDEMLFEVSIPEGGELASFCVSFAQVANSACWKSLPATLGSGTQEVRIKLADIDLTFETVADKTLNIWFRSANDSQSDVLVVKIPSDANGDGFADDLNGEVLGDDEAPVGILFSLTSGSPSILPEFEFQIEATDNVGVSGFCLLETADIPELTNDCWTSAESSKTHRSSISYTVSKAGDNSLNIWFRDEHGNISEKLSISVNFDKQDLVVPTITSVTSSVTTTTTGTVSTRIVGTDNEGITGYCVINISVTAAATDSCFVDVASTTNFDMTVTITVPQGPEVNFFLYLKDAAGNISISEWIVLHHPDTQAPQISNFTIDDFVSSHFTSNFNLSATDNVKLMAYCMKLDDNTPPQDLTAGMPSAEKDPCIVSVKEWEETVTDTSLRFNNGVDQRGSHTMNIWVWDNSYNISEPFALAYTK